MGNLRLGQVQLGANPSPGILLVDHYGLRDMTRRPFRTVVSISDNLSP